MGTGLLVCINLHTVLRKYYMIPERIQAGHVGTCVPRAWEGAKVQKPAGADGHAMGTVKQSSLEH